MTRVVYYAVAPSWTLGHVTRAAAVARRLGDPVVLEAWNGWILDGEGVPRQHVTTETIGPVLDWLRPDVLAVDSFPRGFFAELDAILERIPCRKVLIRRGDPTAELEHLDRYDAVVDLETLGPVLIRDDDELFDRGAARRILGVYDDDRPVIVSLARGSGPIAAVPLDGVAAELDAHVIATGYYPVLELLAGVDVLVGAAGYNLWTEAHACGVPAVWTAFQADQLWRAGADAAADLDGFRTRLLDALDHAGARPPACYVNDAAKVAALIEANA